MPSRVMAKNPGIGFDDARAEARRLLDRAAGKRNYAFPRFLSAEQRVAGQGRLKLAFQPVWEVN
jgi:hypothetical protein